MKTKSEQKEIEKQLNLIAKLYNKIDSLKLENKKLKKQLEELKPKDCTGTVFTGRAFLVPVDENGNNPDFSKSIQLEP